MTELKSIVDFILEVDFMTTKEFCKKFNVPEPTISGGVESFLRIDAIKHRMFVEYAKSLKKQEVNILKELNHKKDLAMYEVSNSMFIQIIGLFSSNLASSITEKRVNKKYNEFVRLKKEINEDSNK